MLAVVKGGSQSLLQPPKTVGGAGVTTSTLDVQNYRDAACDREKLYSQRPFSSIYNAAASGHITGSEEEEAEEASLNKENFE